MFTRQSKNTRDLQFQPL